MANALPRVFLRNEEWFLDIRLEELRAVKEPWKSILLGELNSYECNSICDQMFEIQAFHSGFEVKCAYERR